MPLAALTGKLTQNICSKAKAFKVELSTSLFLLGEGMASGREAKAPWLTRFSLSVATCDKRRQLVCEASTFFSEAWTVLLLYFPGGHHLHQRLPQPELAHWTSKGLTKAHTCFYMQKDLTNCRSESCLHDADDGHDGDDDHDDDDDDDDEEEEEEEEAADDDSDNDFQHQTA